MTPISDNYSVIKTCRYHSSWKICSHNNDNVSSEFFFNFIITIIPQTTMGTGALLGGYFPDVKCVAVFIIVGRNHSSA